MTHVTPPTTGKQSTPLLGPRPVPYAWSKQLRLVQAPVPRRYGHRRWKLPLAPSEHLPAAVRRLPRRTPQQPARLAVTAGISQRRCAQPQGEDRHSTRRTRRRIAATTRVVATPCARTPAISAATDAVMRLGIRRQPSCHGQPTKREHLPDIRIQVWREQRFQRRACCRLGVVHRKLCGGGTRGVQ